MAIEVMAFAVGAILVLTAVLGGGFELRELKVPKVGRVARGAAAVSGAAFLLFAVERVEPGVAVSADPGFVSVAPLSLPTSAFVPVQAQSLEPVSDEWLGEATAGLDADGWARRQGLILEDGIRSGWAAEGESTVIALELEGGREYGILGVCDDDCTDLDLQLLDEAGNLLMEDVEEDAVPRLLVAPQGSGTFYASIRVATCSAAPCRFGVGVYRR